MKIQLLSVNVGMPAVIGVRQGKDVVSGIRKLPITTSTVAVGLTGLDGDGQADPNAHGGFEKAVYAYPVEHLPRWTAELEPDTAFGPGSFGENLTVSGIDETTVCIGDRWQWGDVLLEVCQPRYPCYKLAMVTGRPDVVNTMVSNGRTGWYLRVLATGVAGNDEGIEVVGRDSATVTVAEVHWARLPGADQNLVERVAAAPALASRLRRDLLDNH